MANIKLFAITAILIICISSANSERGPKRISSSFPRVSTRGNKENPNSLLDTFSLSWSGDFHFSKMFEGIRKIFEGLFTCEYILFI